MVRKGNQASLLTGIVLPPSPPDGLFPDSRLLPELFPQSPHYPAWPRIWRFPWLFCPVPCPGVPFRFHVNKAFQGQEEFPKRREGRRRSLGGGVSCVPDDGFGVRQNGQTGEDILGYVVGSFQDEADVFIVGKVVFRFQVAGLVGRFIKGCGLGIRQGDAASSSPARRFSAEGRGVRMSGRPPLLSAKPREAQSSSVI